MKKQIMIIVGVVVLLGVIAAVVVAMRMQSGVQKVDQVTAPVATPDKTFSMEDVAIHPDSTSCYTVINAVVYDLTDWIRKHPGGSQNILKICGKDGSEAFAGQHGGDARPERVLDGFKIGALAQ